MQHRSSIKSDWDLFTFYFFFFCFMIQLSLVNTYIHTRYVPGNSHEYPDMVYLPPIHGSTTKPRRTARGTCENDVQGHGVVSDSRRDVMIQMTIC